MNRSQNYTIAAILQAVISIVMVVTLVPDIGPGRDAIDPSPDSALAYMISYMDVALFALGVMGLISAYGIWQGQKWGVILTIAIRTLDGLMALPGLLFAPTLPIKLMAATGVILALVITALLLWPKPRLAKASEQA